MNIEIKNIESYKDLNLFWDMFYKYINEMFETSLEDKNILNYFLSKDYKREVINLSERDFNPLKMVFFTLNNKIIGFSTYIVFIHDCGKSVILEYFIDKAFRNQNLGTLSFLKLQKQMIKEGAKLIELTPTTNENQLFWEENGFKKTSLFYVDGRNILLKTI